MTTPLFRTEALASQRERHLGAPSLAAPLPARWLGGAALLLAAALLAFAGSAEFTRKARASGVLVPGAGLIQVLAPQAGVLVDKLAVEGQRVRKGEPLYRLSAERSSARSGPAQAVAIEQLRQRRSSLVRELDHLDSLARTEQAELAHRQQALAAELALARAEVATQSERLAAVRQALARHDELARQGFISAAQLAAQRELMLEQQARWQAAERSRSATGRELHTTAALAAAHPSRAASARAAVERGIASLAQEIAEAEARRELLIEAPADGVVTTIVAERGQSVGPSTPLLTLLPEGAPLQAHLFVPSRSAGFVAPEQPVTLRIHAYSFERFGGQRGVVSEVSRTPVSPAEAGTVAALAEPAYRVTVALDSQSVRAYGQDRLLRPGMRLDADIALERRRLIDWVFDPVRAIAGRV